MIPYGHQQISEEDIEAVVSVLRSDYLTQGPKVPEFEQAICDYTTARYGVATNSGTAALHLACLALGLGKGDWLWTTPITFVASSNCGLYCGASVDFVDIDPKSWNLDPLALEQKLAQAEKEGRLPKVLVVVHLCGLSCEMDRIHALSQQYEFSVIEDAAHAIGGQYRGEPVGSGRYSDITTFSFHPVKNITTAEGGMAVTNNLDLADRMRLLRSHGITRDPEKMDQPSDGPWYYQQVELGFNYRMSDLQAALGVSQLKRIEWFVGRRRLIAERYDDALQGLPTQLPLRIDGAESGVHLYVVRVPAKIRKALLEHLREHDIGAHVHYIPVHTQSYYQQLGFKSGDFPEAEKYYSEALTLPIYPLMSETDQQQVVETVQEGMRCLQ